MTDQAKYEPAINAVTGTAEVDGVHKDEIEQKRSCLQRAGTMDATALEGISILRREGVSFGATVDHLRSGGVFKAPVIEADSTQVDGPPAQDAAPSSGNEAENKNSPDNVEADKNANEEFHYQEQDSEPVSSSLEEKEEAVSKKERLQRTLTMEATMEEAKEILKDEERGKTRSKDAEVVSEVEKSEKLEKKHKRGSLERTLTMAATLEESKEILSGADLGKTRARDPQPDSTNEELKSPVRTLSMLATIEEGQTIFKDEVLGKTRSQDRRRLLKRASVSPRTTPSRKSNDGQSSAKRKRK